MFNSEKVKPTSVTILYFPLSKNSASIGDRWYSVNSVKIQEIKCKTYCQCYVNCLMNDLENECMVSIHKSFKMLPGCISNDLLPDYTFEKDVDLLWRAMCLSCGWRLRFKTLFYLFIFSFERAKFKCDWNTLYNLCRRYDILEQVPRARSFYIQRTVFLFCVCVLFFITVAVFFAKLSLMEGYSFHAKSVRNRYKKFQDWPIICMTSSKHVLFL